MTVEAIFLTIVGKHCRAFRTSYASSQVGSAHAAVFARADLIARNHFEQAFYSFEVDPFLLEKPPQALSQVFALIG